MRLKQIRLLIVTIVALCIPLQGIAAATAGLCSALGHHEQQVGHAHDHGLDSKPPDGKAHCVPCVACCATVAISFSVPVFLPDDMPVSAIAAPPAAFSGVQPHALDRPPRPLIA
jgi:hypothetical protein